MGLKTQADALLRSAVESGAVPGVVAMATGRGGTTYEGAFGARVLGEAQPMTLDTVVWIASMTKPVTGAAAMQLVEQGRLDLESPVGRWLPELGAVQVLEGFDEAGQPRLRRPRTPITLRHLMTHTAGFCYGMWDEQMARYAQLKALPPVASGKAASLSIPLVFDPGSKWQYGINLDWVGLAVEAASGQKLGAYFQQHLFEPLGMNSTGFKITPSMRPRLAKIHQRTPPADGAGGKLTPIEMEINQQPEFEMGGGGLYSTAGDYLKFMRMLLDGGTGNGRRVLKAETVRQMGRNAMGPLRVTMLKTASPMISNDAEFFPGIPKSWGLSFMINEQTAPTGRSAGSLSWAGLANTYFWIDPSLGLGGVLLTQMLPFADVKALPLFYAFEQAVYQAA